MLDKIRTLNLERLDAEEAIELVAAGRAALTEYGRYSLPAPAWLTDGVNALDADIQRRRTDMLQARRKELLAKQAALKSREEQRADIEAELARLGELLK